jgi:phospholipase/carboxylesterase
VHIHPPSDGSLHVALPPAMVEAVMDCGWAEIHPVALRGMIPMNIVMVFGPRDEEEIDVVMNLVETSRQRAIPE